MKKLKKPSSKPRLVKAVTSGRPKWRRSTVRVKKHVEWMIANQDALCAFCCFEVGDLSLRRAWAVDHIAPKGKKFYPEWTHEKLNLVVTCHSCNSILKKQYDPVVAPKLTSYKKCTFRFVHPYLDDIEHHLIGTYEGGAVEVDIPKAISEKGAQSLELFGLTDLGYLKAINDQARQIGIDQWKAKGGPNVALYEKLLTEVRGHAI